MSNIIKSCCSPDQRVVSVQYENGGCFQCGSDKITSRCHMKCHGYIEKFYAEGFSETEKDNGRWFCSECYDSFTKCGSCPGKGSCPDKRICDDCAEKGPVCINCEKTPMCRDGESCLKCDDFLDMLTLILRKDRLEQEKEGKLKEKQETQSNL